MIIRNYRDTDKKAVQNICLYSDGFENFSDSSINFLLSTYCDYYTECEPYNCFVAADDNDIAVGYIICAENYDSFIKKFNEEYFTRIPENDTVHLTYASHSTVLHQKYKDSYPAHLHIDILPEYQRMGLGHKLMDALLSHLREKKIKGIMLTLPPHNEKGMSFYKKYGFELLEILPDDTVFGMKL